MGDPARAGAAVNIRAKMAVHAIKVIFCMCNSFRLKVSVFVQIALRQSAGEMGPTPLTLWLLKNQSQGKNHKKTTSETQVQTNDAQVQSMRCVAKKVPRQLNLR
jgi:hypothetical protein